MGKNSGKSTKSKKKQKKKKTVKDFDNPSYYEKVMKREARNLWEKVIEEEYHQLQEENKAFEFIEWNVFRKLTNQHNILGSMLVLLTIKRKADGSIDKYKARLVVQGT
jgi:hypothetical protein